MNSSKISVIAKLEVFNKSRFIYCSEKVIENNSGVYENNY